MMHEGSLVLTPEDSALLVDVLESRPLGSNGVRDRYSELLYSLKESAKLVPAPRVGIKPTNNAMTLLTGIAQPRLCDHSDDEELSNCDSCLEATCMRHAKRYKTYELCHKCGEREQAAKATFQAQVQELLGRMANMGAGDIAASINSLAVDLENFDVDCSREALLS